MDCNSSKPLPRGWVTATLGQIALWGSGGTPSRKNPEFYKGAIPWVKTGELGSKYIRASGERITQEAMNQSSAKVFPAGSVGIAMYGATIGKLSIWASDLSTNQACAVAQPRQELLSSEFLYFFLLSQKHSLIEKGQGGAQPNISQSILRTYPISLPPINEQIRIVAKIEELFSELDKGVESLKAARAKLNVYRQAVLKQAFEGKLTALWREENRDKLETPEQLLARIKQEREVRYEQQLQKWETAVREWEEGGKSGKRPARPRMPTPVSAMAGEGTAHLETRPSGWLWLTAESVGSVQLGRQRSPKNRSKNYPTKYIRAANITEQGLDLHDVLDMDFLPHELSAYRLEKGDLVLSEASGSAAQVGKPAIWNDQIPNCCFQNTVIRHQPYCRDYAVYLLWLYRFFYVSGKFAQVAGGVGINHLSAFKFTQIELPLCSLAEQQEIVGLLEERFAAVEVPGA